MGGGERSKTIKGKRAERTGLPFQRLSIFFTSYVVCLKTGRFEMHMRKHLRLSKEQIERASLKMIFAIKILF